MFALTAPLQRRGLRALGGLAAVAIAALLCAPQLRGAGVLTPRGSPDQPIQIRDHHLNVVITNGFAKTEVFQTFFNPNSTDLEATYSFPVPESASLSELTTYAGELEIHGEVMPKAEAERIYGEEKKKGNDAGLARKNGYQTFEFLVTPVRAQAETKLRLVYYQPLEIDTGVGRYLYPLEEGGTDEVAKSFWVPNEKVEGKFSAEVELKSAWPIADVRLPGFEAAAKIDKKAEGHYTARIESEGASLNRDVVFYYRLADELPGRVELIPFRDDPGKPGTFMMVVTPGIDLKPLTGGADYTFVLDTSGSMKGKIGTLARGVSQALGQMKPHDRFRVVVFNNRARLLTKSWVPASVENVAATIAIVEGLGAGGSTNLYNGLELALKDLDDDRATSIIVVTDGVTNTGVVDPQAFDYLMQQHDVRIFGFLMGNSANWPLVRMICETSGGFYASVSNSDDIIGQILLAKSKVTSECLHHAELTIDGVKTFETTDGLLGKVYRGQQLVVFGRYEQGGQATVTLKASLTGEDKVYRTTFDFPETDTANPEIERLWAMNRIEAIEAEKRVGKQAPGEAEDAIEHLAVQYQLVTDETSMVALSDGAFKKHGVERRNLERTQREHQAQAQRRAQPVQSRQVDRKEPMFGSPAPRIRSRGGGGGGAIDPISGLLLLGIGGLAAARVRRRTK